MNEISWWLWGAFGWWISVWEVHRCEPCLIWRNLILTFTVFLLCGRAFLWSFFLWFLLTWRRSLSLSSLLRFFRLLPKLLRFLFFLVLWISTVTRLLRTNFFSHFSPISTTNRVPQRLLWADFPLCSVFPATISFLIFKFRFSLRCLILWGSQPFR